MAVNTPELGTRQIRGASQWEGRGKMGERERSEGEKMDGGWKMEEKRRKCSVFAGSALFFDPSTLVWTSWIADVEVAPRQGGGSTGRAVARTRLSSSWAGNITQLGCWRTPHPLTVSLQTQKLPQTSNHMSKSRGNSCNRCVPVVLMGMIEVSLEGYEKNLREISLFSIKAV